MRERRLRFLKALHERIFRKRSFALESRTAWACTLVFCIFAAHYLFSGQALAYTTPNVGDPGYPVYDLIVNQFAGGPLGTTFGVGAMMYAAYHCMSLNFGRIIGSAAAGGLLLKGSTFAQSLGANI